MLKLVITDDEGRTTVVPLDRDELTIGRQEGSTIRLTERNVSRKHAVLRRVARGYEIEDLRSYNGTKVGGAKLTAPRLMRDGERFQIGDYQVGLQSARAPVRVGRDGTKTTQIAAEAETALFALPEETRTEAAAAPAARPGGKPRLVVEAGPGRGRHFLLDRDELTIGQAAECEIRLDHASVSRAHAKIVNVGGVRILDLQSTNGVRVNGRDVPYAELEPGDLVELGEVRLRFVVPGAPGRAGARPPARRSTWLLGGTAAGFVLVAVILFVAWPTPSAGPAGTTTPSGPGVAGGANPTSPPTSASPAPEVNGSKVAAFIAVARAHQRKGALDEAEDAANKARDLLQSTGSPTAIPDAILQELVRERAARDELDHARDVLATSPAEALASLDRIPANTDTASDPAVARTAAEALGAMLGQIRDQARDGGRRAEARAAVATLLEHARLAPATLSPELERVRSDARELQSSLAERTVAVGPAAHPPGGGPRHPPGGDQGHEPDPPPERPAGDAQELARYQQVLSASGDPGRYKALACRFVHDFPTSRRAQMARTICGR